MHYITEAVAVGIAVSLAGFIIPFGNVIGPLVLWLVKKEDHPFIDEQGKESLNFQISVTIYSLVSAILICAAGIGILLVLAVSIFSLVFIILASIKSNNGEHYRYPLCIRFIK